MTFDPSTKLSPNKVLAEGMVKALNDNSKMIFNALRHSIEQSIGAQLKIIGNKVFSKTPYKDLFKE